MPLPQEHDHHFYYEVFRADTIGELIPAGIVAITTDADERVKQPEAEKEAMATALVENETALEEKVQIERALAEKTAEKKLLLQRALEVKAENDASMAKLKAEKEADIQLTDSLAMLPAASVSALCFANECSTYFQVGKVCKDQIVEYAERKGQTIEEAEKWMGPYLGYDPEAK